MCLRHPKPFIALLEHEVWERRGVLEISGQASYAHVARVDTSFGTLALLSLDQCRCGCACAKAAELVGSVDVGSSLR